MLSIINSVGLVGYYLKRLWVSPSYQRQLWESYYLGLLFTLWD